MPFSPGLKRAAVAGGVLLLLAIFAVQLSTIVHGQSLSWDEGDHIFSGYMSWKDGDFGLNPEHPPLVKLLATSPLLGLPLRVPQLQNRFFKTEAYLDGRDLLYGNSPRYPAATLIFRVRMAAAILSIVMAALVFFAAREMFGTAAGLLALLLIVFEPNVIAHGAYVTTDMGVSCFMFATVYAFYRYLKSPSLLRLAIVGLAGGLALASKHSAILLLPIMVLLIAAAVLLPRAALPRPEARSRQTLRLAGALAVICVLSVLVLWAFYGFRYAARPAPLALSPSLAEYTQPLRPIEARGILAIAHLRLLPESYLYGLTDVRLVADGWPSYLFGKIYEHGIWYYFPAVFVIKSTLGFLGLLLLTIYATVTGTFNRWLEILFLTIPPVFYFLIAMESNLNIGARHILPVYIFFSVLFAGASVALVRKNRKWAYAIAALVLFHIVSSLRAYPLEIAYSNELWGGPSQTYRYLTDSNADWGQQLPAVKRYLDRHNIHDCWFAYFVEPAIRFEDYGIPCKPLPTFDSMGFGDEIEVPSTIQGTVLINVSDLTGYEFGSNVLNPYRDWQKLQPTALIQGGVLVFNGTFQIPLAAALVHVQRAEQHLKAKEYDQALSEAQTAVSIAPDAFQTQMIFGDVSAAMGHKNEAHAAYERALAMAQTMEPDAQQLWLPQIQSKLAATA